MESKNALENATFAMKLAEDWLGVPMVSYSVHIHRCTSGLVVKVLACNQKVAGSNPTKV